MTENLGLSVTFEAELSRFEKAMQDAGRLVASTTSGMDKATKRAAQSFNQLEAVLDPTSRALSRLERDTSKVQAAVAKGAVSTERAAAVQKRLNDQYEQAIARLNGLGNAHNLSSQAIATGSKTYQRFGAVAQQTGYQIGDLAVQIASGQNAMVALTQQGSQLLGVFGPIGAVMGAAAAIAGALTVAWMKSAEAVDEAAGATADYNKALELSDELLMTSAEASDALAESKLKTARATIQATIAQETENAAILRNRLLREQELQDVGGAMVAPGFSRADAMADLNKQLADAEQKIGRLVDDFAKLDNPANLGSVRDEHIKQATDAWEELERTVAGYKKELEQTEATQRESAIALIESVDPAYAYANEVERLNDLKPALVRLLGDEAKAQAILNEAIEKAGPAYKEAEKAREAFDREQTRLQKQQLRDWSRMVDNAADYGADRMADQFFSRTRKGWGDMLAGMAEDFVRALIHMASQAAMRPIIVTMGTALGLAPAAAVAGGLGGGTDMLSGGLSLSNLFSGSSTLYGFGTDIAASSFGQSLGMSAFGPGGMGPVALTPFGQTFAGGLAGAPWGIAGSLGASLLGLGWKNPIANAAAGGVGSIGGGMAGFALGGPVGAGIGAILGSFGLTSLGGLFGNKQYPTSIGYSLIENGRATPGGTAALDGMKQEDADKLRDSLTASLNAALVAAGANLDPNLVGPLAVGYSKRGALGKGWFSSLDYRGFSGTTRRENFDTAEEAMIDLVRRALLEGTTGLSDEVAQIVATSTTTSVDQLIADIDFAKQLGQMFREAEDAAGPFAAQMKAMADAFEQTKKRAEDLGLATNELAERYAGAVERLKSDFAGQLDTEFFELSGRGYLNQLAALKTQLDQRRKEAAALGVDGGLLFRNYGVGAGNVLKGLSAGQLLDAANSNQTDLVLLNLIAAEVERRDVLESQTQALNDATAATEQWGRALDGIRNLRASLLLSEFSPLSPLGRYGEAQRQFRDTLAAARGGDISAVERLDAVSQAYLQANQDYWASANPAAFQEVQAGLASVETVAERELSLAQQHLNIAEQQLAAINDQSATLQQLAEVLSKLGAAAPGTGGGAGGTFTNVNDYVSHVGTNGTGDFVQRAQDYLARNPDVAAQWQAFSSDPVEAALIHWRDFGQYEGRGFADGGLVTGGVPGVDSVPSLLMPGERVFSVPHSRIIERLAANSDNSAVVEELRAAVWVLQTGFKRLAGQNDRMASDMAEVRAKLGRAA